MNAPMMAARVVSAFGLVTLAGVALAYLLALLGVAVPTGALLLIAAPALFITAVTCIPFARSAATGHAHGFRWWMPLVWIALIVNDGVVWNLADHVTDGGFVEQRAGRAVLVVHGQVIRELDQAGVRVVAVWDAREISSHLLVMLAFTSLTLVALIGPKREPDISSLWH